MCIGVNMDKCDFFKIALKEYLFDHNVIELCLNNYSSSITLRPLREGQEDGEVLPSFFCQFKQINNLYTQLKDESEESVSNQFKKMRCKVKDKYLSVLQDIATKSNINIKVKDLFKKKYKLYIDKFIPQNESRARVYFEMLQEIRRKEEKNDSVEGC